ncbi:MAG: WD40 repeat domain-containing protein [Myxococcales bacterium]|nr:WD40 repeat domain-containing protein [Myxococcales bacterium]
MLRPLLLLSLVACISCKSRESKPPDRDHAPIAEAGEPTMANPVSTGDVDLYGDALPKGASGRLGSLRMVDRSIRQMIFTPEGSQLVSTHRDGYQIWNLTDGSRGAVLEHESPGEHMAISPNGKVLATDNDEGTNVQLWDMGTGKKSAQVAAKSPLAGLCFLTDKKLMAAFSDGAIRVWDLDGESTAFQGPWKDAKTLACAPKAGWAGVGTEDGDAYVVEINSKTSVVEDTTKLGNVSKAIESSAVASDGSAFAFGSADENIYLWYEPKAGEPFSVQAHDRTVANLAFTPDSSQLYSTGGDWWFRKWKPENGELLEELPGIDGLDAQLMALSPDGNLMVSWSQHGGARGSEAGRWWLWNANTGDLLLEPERHRGAITSVQFSPNGEQIATSSEDKSIRTWDAKSGKNTGRRGGSAGIVNDVRFSADGKTLYSAGADALIRAWKHGTKKESVVVEGVGGSVNRFLLTGDGHRVITGDQIGRVWAWDRASGNQIQAYDGRRYSAIYDIAQSPDGKLLAISGSARVVGVIDLERGQEIAELNPGDTAANFAVAFSPDGSLLATAGDGHKIQLWNTSDWTRRTTLSGHDGTVRALAFRPDGKTLISGGNDELVRVWDIDSGKETATLEGHKGVVTSIAIAPDGSQFVSSSRDRTALIWPMPR